ncbi:MAG: metal-sensitive transcriptional regulator [Firmicutes bacterium]|nr:metal-sensitive transcriptional regulator [Bacillota bacterium]
MEPTNFEKTSLINRLRRIEGQVKGIQRMLEEDQCCGDILVQVAAVRSAINRVGMLIFENYSSNCLQSASSPEQQQEAVAELLKTMNSFIKGGGQDGSGR